MKYEPIFGDQSLFDKATRKSTVAIYKISEDLTVEFDKYDVAFDFLQQQSLCDRPDIAMRIIIAEPKRWTVEDQKAGLLPEVGAKCRQGHKDEIVVAVTEKFVVTECQDMSVCTTRKDVFMRSYNPIETPEEKEQRKQEEFVASFNSEKYSNPTLYREGLRDAYRKLKGGE